MKGEVRGMGVDGRVVSAANAFWETWSDRSGGLVNDWPCGTFDGRR